MTDPKVTSWVFRSPAAERSHDHVRTSHRRGIRRGGTAAPGIPGRRRRPASRSGSLSPASVQPCPLASRDSTGPLRSRQSGMVADHDHGAGRVLHAVLAHRAEQRLGEPAVPAAAHHQQIGAVAGVEQYPGGVALGDRRVRDIAGRVEGAADRLSDDLPGDLLEVVVLLGARGYPPVAASSPRPGRAKRSRHPRPRR